MTTTNEADVDRQYFFFINTVFKIIKHVLVYLGLTVYAFTALSTMHIDHNKVYTTHAELVQIDAQRDSMEKLQREIREIQVKLSEDRKQEQGTYAQIVCT